MRGLALIFAVLGFCACSPIKENGWFQEAEYDIDLEKSGQKRFFIEKDEIPIYEQQFAKIKELGQEISCKITGNCNGVKREFISKKSMFGDEGGDEAGQFQDSPLGSFNPAGEGAAGIEGEDVSASMMGAGKTSNFVQKNAESFGQQPQMDIKLSQNEMAAVSDGMGNFSPMGGAGGGPPGGSQMGGGAGGDPMGGASPLTGGGGPPQMPSGNDALMKLREQQNSQVIDSAVQDKLSFMDKANGPSQVPQMPQMPGVTDPLSQFPHAGGEGKGKR